MKKYLREYWFGICVSIVMLLFFALFLIVAFAPHIDAKNRGFIPCSHEMTEKIINCKKMKLLCITNVVFKGNICYIKVIYTGFTAFVKGEQETPWSNYYFTSEIASPQLDKNSPEMKDLLFAEPNLIDGFDDIKNQNIELMKNVNQETTAPELHGPDEEVPPLSVDFDKIDEKNRQISENINNKIKDEKDE